MTDTELQQKRLVAAAIDMGIGLALVFAIWIANFVLGLLLLAVGQGSSLASIASSLIRLVGTGMFAAYLLGRDMLAEGRSIGKRMQDIRVVTAEGAALTVQDSAKRNAIFAIGSVFGLAAAAMQLVPFGGCFACMLAPVWLIGAFLSLFAVGLELFKITQDPAGIRLGDGIAGTRVVR